MVDALLARMLARDPADRFAEAGAVALTIASLLADPSATPAELLSRPPLARQVWGAHSLLAMVDPGDDGPASTERGAGGAGVGDRAGRGARCAGSARRVRRAVRRRCTPAESARRAARCALDVVERAPDLRCSIRTSRGDGSGGSPARSDGPWTLVGRPLPARSRRGRRQRRLARRRLRDRRAGRAAPSSPAGSSPQARVDLLVGRRARAGRPRGDAGRGDRRALRSAGPGPRRSRGGQDAAASRSCAPQAGQPGDRRRRSCAPTATGRRARRPSRPSRSWCGPALKDEVRRRAPAAGRARRDATCASSPARRSTPTQRRGAARGAARLRC